jgi:hypothetical protein
MHVTFHRSVSYVGLRKYGKRSRKYGLPLLEESALQSGFLPIRKRVGVFGTENDIDNTVT